MLDADKLRVNQDCEVKWNGNELLSATVIAMGDNPTMEKTEAELLCEDETESEASSPPPKKAKLTKPAVEKENKKSTPGRKATPARKPLKQVQNVSCACVCMSILKTR